MTIFALVALIAALLVISAWRFQQGFLTGDSALAALRFVLRSVCFPCCCSWSSGDSCLTAGKLRRLQSVPVGLHKNRRDCAPTGRTWHAHEQNAGRHAGVQAREEVRRV